MQNDIEAAIQLLEARGYRVTKPRAKKVSVERPMLNAVGKPYSALYDPKYKPRYRSPSLAIRKDVPWSSISPDQWVRMYETAKQQWEHSKKTGEPLPTYIGHEGHGLNY